MANFELRNGSVPSATTALPRLSDRFGLPDPFRERFADDFEAAGSLAGASVQMGTEAASGTITFSGNPAADSTVTFNGVVFTFKPSGATGNQINIGATLADTLASLASALNASIVAAVALVTYRVVGSALRVQYDAPGTAGNSFMLGVGAGSNATTSGPTLTGGAATTSKVWAIPSGDIVKAGGRISPTTSTSLGGVGRTARFDAALNELEAFIVFRPGDSASNCGVLVRTQDALNTLRVAATPSLFVIQLYEAGAISGTSASVAVSLTVGVDYGLYVRCEGDLITGRLVDLTKLEVIATLTRTTATFNTQTGVGVSLAGSIAASIADFHLSALTG